MVWLAKLVQKLCNFCGLRSEFSSSLNLSFFFLSFLFPSFPCILEVLRFSMFWILLALIQPDMLAQFDFFDWTLYFSWRVLDLILMAGSWPFVSFLDIWSGNAITTDDRTEFAFRCNFVYESCANFTFLCCLLGYLYVGRVFLFSILLTTSAFPA